MSFKVFTIYFILSSLFPISILSDLSACGYAQVGEGYWTFQDDFENGAAKWKLDGNLPSSPEPKLRGTKQSVKELKGWTIEQEGENHVLVGRKHTWAAPDIEICYNFSVELKVKLILGRFHLNLRSLDDTRYFIGINQETLSLSKQVHDDFFHLKTLSARISQGRWHKIKAELQGEHIKVYLDGRLKLIFTDSANPLIMGGFALETLDGSEVWFDDVKLVATKPIQEVKWTQTNGPPGGLGYDIRIHPFDKRIMFVTDNPTGVNKSYDGGRTWVRRNEGIASRSGSSSDAYPIFSLTIDPVDPNIIWTGFQGQKGIYKSYDCGETWAEMVEGIVEEMITVRSFTVDPKNHDVVYTGTEIPTGIQGIEFERVKGKIYKTVDGGKHWFSIWEGGNLIRNIIIDPRDSNVIYAASGIFDREAYNIKGVGILKSTDGGKTWRQINDGLDNLFVGYLEMHPKNPDVLFAAAGNNALAYQGGIYMTTDGGKSWRKVLDGHVLTVVTIAPSNPNIVYAGSASAFFRSDDGGERWQKFAKNNGRAAHSTDGYGPPGIRAGVPISAVVDPDDPFTIFVNNYGGGCFKSTDGGGTWVDSSRGYTGAEIHAVAVDPRNPMTVYAIGRSGPFKSTDGGEGWHGLAYAPADLPEWYEVALNPKNPDEVIITDEHQGIIFKSRNGGRSWREVFKHRLVTASPNDRHGFFDVKFAPSNPNIVYAGMRRDRNAVNSNRITRSYGIFKSTNGSESWFESNGNLPLDARNVNCIAINPLNPDLVYIGTLTAGLFKSHDGGRTWRPMNNGLKSLDVRSIAISPKDSQLLYAGLGEGGGLFSSTNGGERWELVKGGIEVVCPPYLLPLGGGVQDVSFDKPRVVLSSDMYGIPWSVITDIVIDSTEPNRIYVSDWATGVYMSKNGGKSWSPINEGLLMKSVKALAISSDGKFLYAATAGNGVYRLEVL